MIDKFWCVFMALKTSRTLRNYNGVYTL